MLAARKIPIAPMVAPVTVRRAPIHGPNRKPPVSVSTVPVGSEAAVAAAYKTMNVAAASPETRRDLCLEPRAVLAQCRQRHVLMGAGGEGRDDERDDGRQRKPAPDARPANGWIAAHGEAPARSFSAQLYRWSLIRLADCRMACLSELAYWVRCRRTPSSLPPKSAMNQW